MGFLSPNPIRIMSNPPVIDPAAIEALKAINPDDGGEFVREILQIFLEDTPARIGDLEEALRSGDNAKFVRAAHSIKGSASNVGAMLLRESAERLEQHSRDVGIDDVDLLMQELRSRYQLTAEHISKQL